MIETKFSNAVDDLMAQDANARTLAQTIVESQKFYFPKAGDVLEGKPYETVADLFHLPFDCISVLSETTVNDSGDSRSPGLLIPTITVAVKPSMIREIVDDENMQGNLWAVLGSVVYEPKLRIWVGMDFRMGLATCDGGHQYRKLSNSPMVEALLREGWSIQRVLHELAHDSNVIENLCVMLGMRNTKMKLTEPPRALSAARQRRGRAPLWNYHVLVVDGEVWDSPEVTLYGNGAGLRSHLRRGHVRRLEDGRRTWVRATFVHGKVDGFVHKDYAVQVGR